MLELANRFTFEGHRIAWGTIGEGPPLVLVHGDADTLVPLSHSRHTAEVAPTATLRTRADGGHLSVLLEIPQLADEVSASLR